MKVLIAYDGSEYGNDALEDLRRAGLHDVEALVLSVGEVWLPSPEMLHGLPAAAREAVEAHRTRAAQHALAVTGRARSWLHDHFPHWRLTAEGEAGSPVATIIRRAETWGADLVVVGAHGHAAAPPMFPGSVPLGVLRHVHGSARVARRPPQEGTSHTRLLVAVDGSADSPVLLDQVRSRVWPAGTAVEVLTVVDTRLAPLVLPGMSVGPTSEEWARDVAGQASEVLRGCGLGSFPAVERGDPKHVIVDAARRWSADCVFLGARGLNHLPWMNLGSVAGAVAMRAQCSVEIVRAADPAAAAN